VVWEVRVMGYRTPDKDAIIASLEEEIHRLKYKGERKPWKWPKLPKIRRPKWMTFDFIAVTVLLCVAVGIVTGLIFYVRHADAECVAAPHDLCIPGTVEGSGPSFCACTMTNGAELRYRRN
jgi:nitrate reductase NapE component